MTWDEFSFFKAAPVQSDYTGNIGGIKRTAPQQHFVEGKTFGHLLFIILNKTQIEHQHKIYKDC